MSTKVRLDVAREVAPKFGVTTEDADRFVALVIRKIAEMLKSGDEVVFKGFGKFSFVSQEQRVRFYPKGSPAFPSTVVVKFTPYGDLANLEV